LRFVFRCRLFLEAGFEYFPLYSSPPQPGHEFVNVRPSYRQRVDEGSTGSVVGHFKNIGLFSSAQRDKVLLDFKSGIWYFDRAMAKIDRLKEEIGWLKLVFGLLIAIDVSLVGWLAQNYASSSWVLVVAGVIATAVVTLGVVRINRIAYHRIRELEEA